MKKRDRDSWHRLALFWSAEREGRYRADLPVVEVDRREEWLFKALEHSIAVAYGADWREQNDPSFHNLIIAMRARAAFPHSGGMYYQ